MDEGVIEGGEDSGDAEDKLAWDLMSDLFFLVTVSILTFADLGA